MYNHNYYEYHNSKNNKFIFLTLYLDERNNLFKKDFYYEIINYIENNFMYNGIMHNKIHKNTEVYVPSYFTDNKVKLFDVSKEVQKNINNFLSISINMEKKITDYYILENFTKQKIIITNKYKLDGSQYKQHFQCYSEKNSKYYPNGISYILEEHNYRPSQYFIYFVIKRIISFYIFISIFLILSIFYYFI